MTDLETTLTDTLKWLQLRSILTFALGLPTPLRPTTVVNRDQLHEFLQDHWPAGQRPDHTLIDELTNSNNLLIGLLVRAVEQLHVLNLHHTDALHYLNTIGALPDHLKELLK